MNYGELAKQLERGDITLEATIHKGIPEEMLHLFACDCAERALLREQSILRGTDERSWKAIECKRLWIHEKAKGAERAAALKEAQDAVQLANERCIYAKRRAGLNSAYRTVWIREKASEAAAESAFKSCIKDAKRAALHASSLALESATRSSSRNKEEARFIEKQERAWQARRLCWYLSLLTFAGHRWISIAPGSQTPAADDPNCAVDVDLHIPIPRQQRSPQPILEPALQPVAS